MNSRWLRHAAIAALLSASATTYICTPAEAAEPTIPVRVVTQVKGGILEISVTWANEASPIFKSEYSSGAARITIDGASLKGSTQVVPLDGDNAKEALVSQVDDETVVVNIRAANEPNIKVFQIPAVKNVKGVKYVLPINLLTNKSTAAAPKAETSKPAAAAATKAEASKPAATATKAEANKPAATAAKAEAKKPAAATPKAETSKPATAAPKAEANKPAAAATKAEASKPAAAATKAEANKPAAAAPKAETSKPAAAAPKAETSKPAAAATRAEASKPAANATKAEANKPAAAATKAEANKPAANATKAEANKPAANATKADASKPAAAAPKVETVRKVDTKPAPPQLTAKDDPVNVKVIFNPKADELRIGLVYKGNLKNVVKRASGSGSTMSIELCPATLQGPTQAAKLDKGQIISYQAKQAAPNKVLIEVKVQNPPYFVQDVDVHGGAFYGISYNYAQDYKPAAAVTKAEANKPAAAPKAEASKPAAAAPKAEASKPAATAPKAETNKPAAAAPKAETSKPAAAAPKAEASKPAAAAPKAEASKPAAAAPKAEASKPEPTKQAEPTTAPKAAPANTSAPTAETNAMQEKVIVKDHYAYFPLKERSAAAVAESLIKLYPNVTFKIDPMLNVIFVQGSAEDVSKISNVLRVVSNFEK